MAPLFRQFAIGLTISALATVARGEMRTSTNNYRARAVEGKVVNGHHIESAIQSPRHSNGLNFVETPLEEVVNLMQEEYGIPIQLDTAAMEEVGVDPSTPITVNLHNISLRSALRIMLKKLQLTYVIQNEVLMITTPEEAETQLVVKVYPVADLVTLPSSGLGVRDQRFVLGKLEASESSRLRNRDNTNVASANLKRQPHVLNGRLEQGIQLKGLLLQRGFGHWQGRLEIIALHGFTFDALLHLDAIATGDYAGENVGAILEMKGRLIDDSVLELTATAIRRPSRNPQINIRGDNVGIVYRGIVMGNRIVGHSQGTRQSRTGNISFEFRVPNIAPVVPAPSIKLTTAPRAPTDGWFTLNSREGNFEARFPSEPNLKRNGTLADGSGMVVDEWRVESNQHESAAFYQILVMRIGEHHPASSWVPEQHFHTLAQMAKSALHGNPTSESDDFEYRLAQNEHVKVQGRTAVRRHFIADGKGVRNSINELCVVAGEYVYSVSVVTVFGVGRKSHVSDEEIEKFLESFRILAPPDAGTALEESPEVAE